MTHTIKFIICILKTSIFRLCFLSLPLPTWSLLRERFLLAGLVLGINDSGQYQNIFLVTGLEHRTKSLLEITQSLVGRDL